MRAIAASGYGAQDKVSKSGDTMTGTLTMGGSPPVNVPGATSGEILTSDSSGNFTPQPSSGGGPLLTQTAVKTGNYTASANQVVPVDTTSASVTVTLPTAPAGGTLLAVKQVTLGAGHSVTVACGGSDVFNKSGGATTVSLTLLGQGVLLEYNSGIWMVLSDDLPLAQADARYAEVANNLSDLASASSARTNLGLGTAATQPSSAFDAAGAASTAQSNAEAACLLLTGGTMSGAIAMGSHKITGLTNGSGAQDAAAFGQIPLIDSTAGDIQPLGSSAVAGSTGKAADAGHVHPETGVALLAGATFTGAVSPAVVALTDGSSISVNAAAGNDFRVTIAGNRTMANPSGLVDGQRLVFQITQDGSGSRTMSWGTNYEFSTGLPQPVLTTTPNQTDLVGFIYNAAKGKLLCVAFVNGFA